MSGALTRTVAFFWIVLSGLARAEDMGTSFRDDFDVLDHGRWTLSDGWSNGDWMNCTWSRRGVTTEQGRLVLSFIENPARPDEYLCGEIQSRAVYGYGTYEVSLKTGTGSGLNAAFFTYTGPAHGRAHHEIDVEILLRDTSEASFNTYVDGAARYGASVPLPGPSDEGFTHYAFQWRPEGVTWFVNGREVHKTPAGATSPAPPQKIYASLWGSRVFDDWMGAFDGSAVPARAQIEWLAFTGLGEDCHFPDSLLCRTDRK